MAEEENKNFYDLLGVLPSASMAELKRAYRDKARAFHPDLNPSEESQAQFRAVQEAYNLLRDPVERTFYDRGLGFKSNWVEEAAKSSERKKAKERTRRAEAAMGNKAPPPPKEASRKPAAEASKERSKTPPSPPPSDKDQRPDPDQAHPSAEGKGSAQGGRGSRSRRFTGFGSKASERRRSFTGASARPTGQSSSQSSGPSTKPPEAPGAGQPSPPTPPKTKWYRDRALRIFLFGANSLAALVLFFTAPSRGAYFLVIAFGIELLYRVSDLAPPKNPN